MSVINKKILIVTEANDMVASGHLYESIVCNEYFCEMGLNSNLMINADVSNKLKSNISGKYFMYDGNIQSNLEYLIDFVNSNKYIIIIFNLRKIENDYIIKLKEKTKAYIVCIDEFGNRTLDADVIINPMIDTRYHKYEDASAKIYCGQQYLVLPRIISDYHSKNKQIYENVNVITVSMGGVDCGNSTIKMAEWLPGINPNGRINLVLGGGYKNKKELEKIVGNNDNIFIYENIDFLPSLFYESDIAICAGGNTLHELAAIGTPTIVIPSMSHEFDNGIAYSSQGFSICGSIAQRMNKHEFELIYNELKDFDTRKKMSLICKNISDGKGYERVFRIVSEILK